VTAAPDSPQIRVAGSTRIPELRELWRELHRHHRAVSAMPVQPDDELSWRLSEAQYASALATGNAFLLIADGASGPVGYAMVVIHAGPDDTYGFPGAFGEVVTLVVSAAGRGDGLGGRLLDAADAELAARGVNDQIIAVMAGNLDAQRLYERRGFAVGEIILFRQGP
jgi:ribosomal protein S18 acetylase RimI-like enzyme